MNDKVLSAKRYIELHFAKISHVDKIPRTLDISYEHLRKIFACETGEPLRKYLCEVRVEKAKELLRDHGMKLYTIARKVGFPNEQALIRHFKKSTGMTPTKFRISL